MEFFSYTKLKSSVVFEVSYFTNDFCKNIHRMAL